MRTTLFHMEAQFSAAKLEKMMKRYELFYGKDYQQHFVADAYAETPRKAVQFFASYYPEDAADVKSVSLVKDGGMHANVHPRHWKH